MRDRVSLSWVLLLCIFTLGGCAQRRTLDHGPLREVVELSGGGGSALFSPAIRTDNLLFLSGVVGRSENGDIPEATRNALEGIRARVEEIGATMADIVQCTVFLTDIADYQEMNEAYVEHFPSEPPARTAVAVVAVPASAQMEIACIAVIP